VNAPFSPLEPRHGPRRVVPQRPLVIGQSSGAALSAAILSHGGMRGSWRALPRHKRKQVRWMLGDAR